MSLQIPLNGPSASASASGGVTIPIGSTLRVPQVYGVSREEKVVRAVAAAAALQDPAAALALAKQAVEDPATVGGNVIDPVLNPVLQTVATAIDSPSAAQPSSEQSAAARAVKVDAALVAVAETALKTATSTAVPTTEAREWVAHIEPFLLERAARAVLRQRNLNLVPTKPTAPVATSRLNAVEQRLKTLEEAQKTGGGAARKRN